MGFVDDPAREWSAREWYGSMIRAYAVRNVAADFAISDAMDQVITSTPVVKEGKLADLARSFARHVRTPALRSAFVRWLKLLIRGEGDTRSLSWWLVRSHLQPKEFVARFNAIMVAADNMNLLHICDCCLHAFWEIDAHIVGGGSDVVCDPCYSDRYTKCACCEEMEPIETITYVYEYGRVCEGCLNGSVSACSCPVCENYFLYENMVEVDGNYYCEEDAPVSECNPTHLEFEFPALCTPGKSVKNDEVTTITVGQGDISQEGMSAIYTFIRERTGRHNINRTLLSWGLTMDELLQAELFDRSWQTKEGNFTKRLAKHMLVERSVKVTEEVMAEIGNLAKAHSGIGGTHYLSLTRNLNLSRQEFVNTGSCWWTDYASSRCELKAWHGFGVRTFSSKSGTDPVSRAWLLPLTAKVGGRYVTWGKTATLPADAYILFNPYYIDQLAFGRMIAGMTGKSYRKIAFSANMYINDSHGILIADQEICDVVTEIELPRKRTCTCHLR